MATRKKLEITNSSKIIPVTDRIKASNVEGLEDTMQTVSGINSKFDILERKMNIIKKKDRRRDWTNPRRYRSSGNSRKA